MKYTTRHYQNMLRKVTEFDVEIYCTENPEEDVVEMRNAKKRAILQLSATIQAKRIINKLVQTWHKPQTKQA